MQWPEYLVDRAVQSAVSDLCTVAGSTPVVAFGDLVASSVATLGINPSSREFLDGAGRLMFGANRRLATLVSLGVHRYEDLTRDYGEVIVEECASYFERRPYGRWFDPLDRILRSATGTSYYDRTACHLDLVQWATDPVWGRLDSRIRRALLQQDAGFLRRQLGRPDLRVVIVNGRAVVEQTEALSLVRWQQVATLRDPTAQVLVGEADGTRFIGWTCNLQSQHGALRHEARLAELLAAHIAIPVVTVPTRPPESQMAPPPDAPAPSALPPHLAPHNELMPKRQRFATKRDLVAALEAWLDRSSSDTIGDTSRQKRTPWLFVDTPVGRVRIHADTTRAGVQALVAAARSRRTYDWFVVTNDRGRINKVLFSNERTPGWYAYLAEPLEEEGPIGNGRG